jgi:leucyl-tRNA synthetase
MEVIVQVNGKLRGKFTCATGTDEEALKTTAQEVESVKTFLSGKTIRKIIVVRGKLVNIVVG